MIERFAPLKIGSSHALFLDFDGTLVEIAARPEAVVVEPATRAALEQLRASLAGAVAIVTGRDIGAIDQWLAPLSMPVAGVHGRVRRDAHGRIHAAAPLPGFHEEIERALTPLLQRNPALFIERKDGAIALHSRAVPALEEVCAALMRHAVEDRRDVTLKRGKAVIEAVDGMYDKGAAIAAFMRETPFAGRIPMFAGDDLTDEDAFAAVNALGGLSVKIGPGETCARVRVADTATFLHWLRAASGAFANAV
jgi:trehalose 6-phosphate phosphatase